MTEQLLRDPPSSINAEQYVLGGLLLDKDAIDRIGDLRPEHFYRHDHRQIFEAMLRMITADERVDVVTVFESLNARGKAEIPNLLVYLNELMTNIPSAANIRRHAEIVRDRALKRDLISATDEIAELAFHGEGTAREILDKAGTRLEKLAESRESGEPVRAGDEMHAHLGVIDARTEGIVRAVPTGFGDLDRRLNGGIRRGQVVVVAGRPSMGKTAFALGIARHAAVDYSVLMLSMEMPKAELHDRNLAAIGHVDLSNLLSARGLASDEWQRIMAASQDVERLNLFLDDQGGLRLLDVRLKARLVKRRHGLDLLIIDYLGLMEGSGENRYAQIGGISRGLKALAKELDVGLILLSQLNRKLEERPDKRPQISDLRDSGDIEQDADVVMLLYRDEVYNPNTDAAGICEVHVAKNRQGSTGREALTYLGSQVRFESHAGGWQPSLASIAPRRARQFEAA